MSEELIFEMSAWDYFADKLDDGGVNTLLSGLDINLVGGNRSKVVHTTNLISEFNQLQTDYDYLSFGSGPTYFDFIGSGSYGDQTYRVEKLEELTAAASTAGITESSLPIIIIGTQDWFREKPDQCQKEADYFEKTGKLPKHYREEDGESKTKRRKHQDSKNKDSKRRHDSKKVEPPFTEGLKAGIDGYVATKVFNRFFDWDSTAANFITTAKYDLWTYSDSEKEFLLNADSDATTFYFSD